MHHVEEHMAATQAVTYSHHPTASGLPLEMLSPLSQTCRIAPHHQDWDTGTTTNPCSIPGSRIDCLPTNPALLVMPSPGGNPPQGEYHDDMSDSGSSNISSASLLSQTSVDESCRRALPHFPRPALSFPLPALEFDFRVAVALNPEPSRVESKVNKEITTVTAGQWSGSFGNGRILAGGYDLGQARGFRPIRVVEGAFVMQTTDQPPAMQMRTRGSLSGPCNILDSLLGPGPSKDIDPRQYGFRMFATVKTPDKRYAEIVNCGLWVASGMWSGEELIIE
ncbi:hypothetical protein E4U41_006356 [Claviceps citrina]|nr:hypothetical protein E4U41_006356 [Claviceps citrina]